MEHNHKLKITSRTAGHPAKTTAWQKTPPAAIDPIPQLDEMIIQDLLDASIRESAGIRMDEPSNLDTSLSGSWKFSRK